MTQPKYGKGLIILSLGTSSTWHLDGGKQRTIEAVEKIFGKDTEAGVSPETGQAVLHSMFIQHETSRDGVDFIRDQILSWRKEFPIVPPRTYERLGEFLRLYMAPEQADEAAREIVRLVDYDKTPEALCEPEELRDTDLGDLAEDIAAGVYDKPGEATQHFPVVELADGVHRCSETEVLHPDHDGMDCEEFNARVASAKQGAAEFNVSLETPPEPPADIPHHTWLDPATNTWVGHPAHLGVFCADFRPSYRDGAHRYEDLPDGTEHPGHSGITCLLFEETEGGLYCRPGAHLPQVDGLGKHFCTLPVPKMEAIDHKFNAYGDVTVNHPAHPGLSCREWEEGDGAKYCWPNSHVPTEGNTDLHVCRVYPGNPEQVD